MEIGQHWKKGERALRDIKGNIIMDFSLEAIKIIFQWNSEGKFDYIEEKLLVCYEDTNRVATEIKSWMLEKHHVLKGNTLINAPHSHFYPSMDLMILMLLRVLEKEDASKF